MLTYAQNFEDVMLERIFREVVQGFYIDVGAWDPTRHSITRHFYDRGWYGINVEPIAARIQLFNQERPRDINLAVAVGQKPGVMTFYEVEDESYLSTLDTSVASGLRARGIKVRTYEVEVTTLEAIFERCNDKIVDFLKIDVEGFEGELLKGVDLSRHRPRTIVVEATLPGVQLTTWDRPEVIGTWAEWEPRVLECGYILVHFDGLNRFYLREEDRHLAPRLSLPPCLHDNIEYPEVGELRRTVAEIRLDQAAKEKVIQRLERAGVSIQSELMSARSEV